MIICNDKDRPWITLTIKIVIKQKHQVYNRLAKRGHKLGEWECVRMIQNETCRISRMITDAKGTTFRLLDENSLI